MLRDKKLNAYFESKEDMDSVFDLLRPSCSVCNEKFPTPGKLKEHLRKTHDLYLCDICIAHTRKFYSEYKVYSRKDLLAHFRNDPTLNLENGHPLCQFCDLRMYDNDHLKVHLRTVHVHCGLCDRLGKRNEYCLDQDALRRHYREVHVVCDHPDCADVAFANDVELRGHMAKEHLQGTSRSKARQALSLGVNLVFDDQGRNTRRSDRSVVPRHDLDGGHSEEQQLRSAMAASLLSDESSPALPSRGGSAAASASAASSGAGAGGAGGAGARGPSTGPGFAAASGAMASTVMSQEHFPALTGEGPRLGPVRSNYNGVLGSSMASAAPRAAAAPVDVQPEVRAPARGEYILLDDAKDRNANLIREVTRILGRGASLDRFKTQSAAFRKGDVSPNDYCQACRTLLGDYFNDAFAELITLLPDIGQQRALLAACRAQSSSAWGGLGLDLVECECGQVMRRTDLASHTRSHGGDTAFPGLPTAAKPRSQGHFTKANRGRKW